MKDNAGLSAVYCTGIIGAVIYYLQTSTSFVDGVWGIIKSFFWPGVLVFEAFQRLSL